jgi:hypothetical protein
MRYRRAKPIAITSSSAMGCRQESSRRQQQRWKAQNSAVGQMPFAANQPEHRSSTRNARQLINMHQADANKQHTYSAAAVKHQDNTVIVNKAATYHTVDMDNIYCYPFEHIPHLLITGRYSGAHYRETN